MPRSKPAKAPSRAQLRELQETVLRAVLRGEPLPGGDRAVRFPDLGFVLRHPTVAVGKENLAGAVTVDDAPKPIRIVPGAALAREAADRGEDVAWLQFEPAQATADEVRLTLTGRIAPSNASDPTELSRVQVRFRRDGDRWVVAEPPVYSAA